MPRGVLQTSQRARVLLGVGGAWLVRGGPCGRAVCGVLYLSSPTSPPGAGPDPAKVLTRAAAELRAVNRGLRTLVEGVCPATLTEQGLVAAVEALAERAPLPVAVAVPARRWPQRAELALYYVVTEGLANVYRHAGASRAEIRITPSRGKLILELSNSRTLELSSSRTTAVAVPTSWPERVCADSRTGSAHSAAPWCWTAPGDAGPGSPWSCRACDDRRRLRSAASVAR